MRTSIGLLGYGEVGQVLAKSLATKGALRIYDPLYPCVQLPNGQTLPSYLMRSTRRTL